MPPQQTSLLSPTELAYLHSSLSFSPPLRPDARSPTTFRPLVAELDLLPSANGSARLCFADGTEGIVGIKAELERSTPNGQGEVSSQIDALEGVEAAAHAAAPARRHTKHGWVEVTIDMPGPRDDDSNVVFLAQMIHEGLVADGALHWRLLINQRWHWKLYIDILLLSPPASYPLPLLSLSTHLALLSTRLPAPVSQGAEDPLFNDDWDASLRLYPSPNRTGKESADSTSSKPPVTLLVMAIGSNIFFDPSRDELAVAEAVLALTVITTSASVVKVLGIRSIDPPSRLSSSSSAALGGEPGFSQDGGMVEECSWRPARGGMKRSLLGRMLKECTKTGGVGQEVLDKLGAFG